MTTIVIVPGSFVKADAYDIQAKSLQAAGFEVAVISTPSVGFRAQGAATMTDDVNEIIRVVEPLLEQNKRVILLTHSYGGVPGTQSMKTLSKKARSAANKTGGIETVVYLTSLILPVDTSNFSLFRERLETMKVEDNYIYLDGQDVAVDTFGDLPPDEAKLWAAKLSTQSLLSFKEPLTYAGYSDVNTHYILTEKDKVIPPEGQQGMIEILKANSPSVQVHNLATDHAPIVSRADDVTKIVKGIADSLDADKA